MYFPTGPRIGFILPDGKRLEIRSPRSRRVPPFYPVPVRGRHDGWSPERQVAVGAALGAPARKVTMGDEHILAFGA